MVETNVADKTKLGGPVGEKDDSHVIAKNILRRGKLARPGCDFELGFEYLLVVVVARTQHHAVLTEGDQLMIMIRRNVSDAENWHSFPFLMDTPTTCISATCISRAKFRACFPRDRERQ